MSYEMKSLRKEDLSLYYYIKDTVLRDFVEMEEEVALNLMPDLCSYTSYVYEIDTDIEPSPFERGRGLRYFDDPELGLNCEPYTAVSGIDGAGDAGYGTPEQSTQVIVYETSSSGTLDAVAWQDYMIDYIDGRIITSSKLNTPKITFNWNYISLVDEWAAIEASDPPVVVVDMSGTDKSGFQLGGGKKTVRKVDIHIFASNTAERNDIVETIYDGLYNRSCPLYDFPTGTVLDYDGTFYGRRDLEDRLGYQDNKLTYLFNRSMSSTRSKLFFESVTSRHVNLPLIMSRGTDEVMLSDLNAYRSKISFDLVSYDDGE
jgi:hypothetical protein